MKTQKDLPTIFVDLDGTLVNTIEETLVELYKLFNVVATPEDITEYGIGESLHRIFPLSLTELNHLLLRLWERTDIFARAKPYWGLLSRLNDFIEAGGTVYPITKRRAYGPIKCMTIDWVYLWLPGAQCVIFAGDKSAAIRVRAFQYEQWFVDDCHATCLQVHETTVAAGWPGGLLTIYVPERPWTKQLFSLKPIVKRCIEQDIEELLQPEKSKADQ